MESNVIKFNLNASFGFIIWVRLGNSMEEKVFETFWVILISFLLMPKISII